MTKPLFTITNKAADTLVIDIEGCIGGFTYDRATDTITEGATKEAVAKLLKDVANAKVSNITVNINSFGGDVNHGISIHDMLAEHKAKVTTVAHGMTASAATIIHQAGDVRKMSDNALFLVHPASTGAYGNAGDLKAAISDLEKIDGLIAGIYAKRTGKTIEEVLSVMNRLDGRGEWLTAAEAKDLGFIDEVFQPMKAVAMADPSLLAKFGLPGIPQGKIKLENADMKAEKSTVQAWFNEFLAGITGKKIVAEVTEPIVEPTTEPGTQVIDKDNPEGITVADTTEVVIRDMAEVQTVLNDFIEQVTERDATIAANVARITALEADLAQAKGLPTTTEMKDDPLLDPGKTVGNEAAAEKNAEALRSK